LYRWNYNIAGPNHVATRNAIPNITRGPCIIQNSNTNCTTYNLQFYTCSKWRTRLYLSEGFSATTRDGGARQEGAPVLGMLLDREGPADRDAEGQRRQRAADGPRDPDHGVGPPPARRRASNGASDWGGGASTRHWVTGNQPGDWGGGASP
jgi:hypothetical protein